MGNYKNTNCKNSLKIALITQKESQTHLGQVSQNMRLRVQHEQK